jgi:F-box/leucine-rich repeat protein 14
VIKGKGYELQILKEYLIMQEITNNIMIPQDAWNQILNAQQADDLICISRVSRAFRAIVNAYRITEANRGRLIKELGIALLPFAIDNQLTSINLTPLDGVTCRSVEAFSKHIDDDLMLRLGVLTTLRHLNLSRCHNISDIGVKALTVNTQLQKLHFSGCEITDQGVKALCTLAHLQDLVLAFCSQITTEGIKTLSTLTCLHSLSLSYCIQITDHGLTALTTLTRLKSLDLSHCQKITGRGLREIEKFTLLEYLNLFTASSHKSVKLSNFSLP